VSSPSRGRHFEALVSLGLDTMSSVGSNFSALLCLSLICFVRFGRLGLFIISGTSNYFEDFRWYTELGFLSGVNCTWID
jgi:hypothetical protein